MRHSNSIRKLEHPEYLSFVGQYVFSVPKNMVVDEQIIAGMQVIYSGVVTNKTLEEIYDTNNIAIQPIAPLKDDHKPDSFKKYVDETFVPEAKQKLSPDVEVKFGKQHDWDVAKVTIKKEGKPYRFVLLKNGLHPVAVISKEETDSFSKIEQSITDVEKTDLKKEAAPIKQAIQNIAQLIKDKNAGQLYNQLASDQKSKNSQDQLAKLLAAEEVYSQGAITANGGSYTGNEFASVINFAPLNTDFKPASGVLDLQKVKGQWKLKTMQLPNPAANKVSG